MPLILSDNDLAFPVDRQGTYVEINTLPGGASVDNIFYFNSPNVGKFLKLIINGPLRATSAGIYADGADQTTRFNAALAHADVKEIHFDDVKGGIYVLNGTITVPKTKKIIVTKGNTLGGTGTLALVGELISDRSKVFELSLNVLWYSNTNPVVYPEQFGAVVVDDARVDTIGGAVIDSTAAWQKMLDSLRAAGNYNPPNPRILQVVDIKMSGWYAFTDQIDFTGCSVRILGTQPLYQGTGFRLCGTLDTSWATKSFLKVEEAEWFFMEGVGIKGIRTTNPAIRPYAAIQIKLTNGGWTQRRHHYERIIIGDGLGYFSDADLGYEFANGIISDGEDGNNDFMYLNNIHIYDCEIGIRNAKSQNVQWTINLYECGKAEWMYQSDEGGGSHSCTGWFGAYGIKQGGINILGDDNRLFRGDFHEFSMENLEGNYILKSNSGTSIRFYNAFFSFLRDGTNLTVPKIISTRGFKTNIQFIGGNYFGITGGNPGAMKAEIEYTGDLFTMNRLAFTAGFAGFENSIILKKPGVNPLIHLKVEPKLAATFYGAKNLDRVISANDPAFVGDSFNIITSFTDNSDRNETELNTNKLYLGESSKGGLLEQGVSNQTYATPVTANTHSMVVPGILPGGKLIKGVGIYTIHSLVAGTNVWDYMTVGDIDDEERWGRVIGPNALVKNTKPTNYVYNTAVKDLILKIFTDGDLLSATFSQTGTTLTSTSGIFAAGDVGKTFEWNSGEFKGLTATISAFTSSSQVTVSTNMTVPASSGRIRSYFNISLGARTFDIIIATEINNAYTEKSTASWLAYIPPFAP